LYRHRYFFGLAGVFAGAGFFLATAVFVAAFAGTFFAAVFLDAD
jgi:hypothetical protein